MALFIRIPYHMVLRVHLDTDFGGDPDDARALAMPLGWPEVEIVGITTTLDRTGPRAAYVHHVLGDHYDPVACAVALGWAGAIVEDTRLIARLRDGVLHTLPDPRGKPTRVVTAIDGDGFRELWLSAVEVSQRR